MKLPPWSYTMMSAFENCPKQAFHRYLLKEKSPETPEQRKGNLFDKAVEKRIRDNVPLAPEYQQYEPFAASLASMKSKEVKAYAQLKMGISRDFKPVGFFDDAVWGRGVLDVALVGQNSAFITDWKTGKNKEGKSYDDDGLQLKIFAALTFKNFPRIGKVSALNVWLKDKALGKLRTWRRDDQAALWQEILPKVLKVEEAFAKQEWPACQGPLCGWCPVVTCNFHPEKKQ